MIIVPMTASHGSLFYKTINQLNHGVMAQAESLGEYGNGGTSPLWQTLDGEEQLVLPWFDAAGTGRLLAKVQELPDTVSELSQPSKTFIRNIVR